MLRLNDSNFAEEITSGVAVVDFAAVWCAPCRMMAPVFEKWAASAPEQVKFAKVDIDEAQDMARRFSISAVPTILILKDGVEVQRHVGVVSEATLKSGLGLVL